MHREVGLHTAVRVLDPSLLENQQSRRKLMADEAYATSIHLHRSGKYLYYVDLSKYDENRAFCAMICCFGWPESRT
jgi:hypothetical protein